MRDETTSDLVFALAFGAFVEAGAARPGHRALGGKNRRPVIINDVSNDKCFYTEVDKASDFRTCSILTAPLLTGDELLGVVKVLNKRARAFVTVSDQNHLTLLAHLASLALSKLSRRKA
ncbi:MAG: GAF domain-containing protein [Gammaproteobacteria bacterium]|nr:GAF domain-containing protein [Gammaproteobacteria bacterium]